ncbi:MAG: hypothetical protein ABSE90_06580 [Verrucomicrobiota bacterium]
MLNRYKAGLGCATVLASQSSGIFIFVQAGAGSCDGGVAATRIAASLFNCMVPAKTLPPSVRKGGFDLTVRVRLWKICVCETGQDVVFYTDSETFYHF